MIRLRSLPLWIALAFVCVAAASTATCVSQHTQDCGDGLVCPEGTECAFNQNVCIRDACGNGTVDTDEVCDDGNIEDGDGCSANCKSDETCGNGVLDDSDAMAVKEVCDHGDTVDGDGCSANCLSQETCGNGIRDVNIETPEACDDGNNNNNDGCNNACTSDNSCGNGVTDGNVGEACDDAHAPGGCNDDCQGGVNCHDGTRDPGEECDDGNTNMADECVDFDVNRDGTICDPAATPPCTIPGPAEMCRTARCGDGVKRDDGSLFVEACDTAGDSDTCNADCTVPECGDSYVNDQFTPPDQPSDPNPFALPEQCDNGAAGADSATCTHYCTVSFCGDGYFNAADTNEHCDTGGDSGTCDDDCSAPSCGDGHLNRAFDPDGAGPLTGEECDDGNTAGGDGCNAQCQLESCHDGQLDTAAGEQCDDGNLLDTDACVDSCVNARCGDFHVRAGTEACDTGPDSNTCDSDCTLPTCGDGHINLLHSEVCDPGSTTVPTASCDLDCTFAFCGDGTVNATRSEACDPGSTTVPSGSCDLDCTAASCGDGYLNTHFDPDGAGPLTGEQCDDGGTTSGDGCSALCQNEPFALTVTRTGTGAGSVASAPAGITCGADCSEPYPLNTSVTLTPTVGSLSVFTGWSGACTGTGACVVAMNAAKNVVAQFDLNTLTVAKAGNGTGTVTATGITCGADCTESYDNNTAVTLTAAASGNSTFTGWSGGGCAGTGTCVTTMTGAKTVTATFTLQQFALTVVPAGTGAGTVTSAPSGINCGATCAASYDSGTSVTLTASPSTGSTFTGWSGGGCSGTGACTVSVTAATSVTATFTINTYLLAVAKNGSGTGTVTSAPSGITCGATCSASYNHGTVVTLTAGADATSTFTGWSGAGCAGTGTCVVTMTAAASVTATFTLRQYTLTTSKTGTGTGTITSTPSGINCGATCSASYSSGQQVTLTATEGGSSTFTGWSGACTGTGACTVTMNADQAVTANFDTGLKAVNVTKAGTGGGVVSSAPAGINCGATCTGNFTQNSSVTLTAVANADSVFTGWSGSGCSGTGPCVLNMNGDKNVTATFTLNQFTLTAAKVGQGSVDSSPAGITCGADCTQNYASGTTVGLVATPASGWTFTGWSDAGCPGTGICFVTVTAATTVTATFTQNTYALDVYKAGNGTVTSAPAGINCGATCSHSFASGTSVVLSATPGPFYTFTGWVGAGCSGTGTCTIAMNQATSVWAAFAKTQNTLTVTKAGTAATSGTVSANPAGINCGATCSAPYDFDAVVVLTATPAANSTFTGWTGDCSGTGSCIVTMSAARNVTATFTLDQFALNALKAGNGAGTVTSVDTFINCGATCTHTYDYNTSVTLNAAGSVGSTFTGWSGGGCAGTGSCVVAVTALTDVTATFTLNTFALTVTRAGAGAAAGVVTSVDTFISCPGTCSHTYNYGDSVTLNAAPATGVFTGGCTGTGTCTTTVTGATAVTATF